MVGGSVPREMRPHICNLVILRRRMTEPIGSGVEHLTVNLRVVIDHNRSRHATRVSPPLES